VENAKCTLNVDSHFALPIIEAVLVFRKVPARIRSDHLQAGEHNGNTKAQEKHKKINVCNTWLLHAYASSPFKKYSDGSFLSSKNSLPNEDMV